MMVCPIIHYAISIIFLSVVSATSFSKKKLQNNPSVRQLGNNDDDHFEADLSTFSVRYGKCQYVKMYSDEIAEDEESDSVFAVKHFVLYRLCPSDECETCDDIYGEYVADVQDYLTATSEQEKQVFQNMCDNCNEECDDDGGGCEEDGCGWQCWRYDNMEDNGYVDASEFIECAQADVDFDDDFQLYIGPRCSSDGTRIFIGLFTDENCWEPYEDRDVEELLGLQLSYYFLRNSYSSDEGECMTCLEEDDNQNDQQDVDDVNEMCENLYIASGKCEFPHGLESGFIQMNKEEEDFENQVQNEFLVCDFIDSLLWNSYTETGEINIYEEQDHIERETTTVQKLSLSLLAFTCLAIAIYAAYLHREINIGFPNVDLSSQGGQLA